MGPISCDYRVSCDYRAYATIRVGRQWFLAVFWCNESSLSQFSATLTYYLAYSSKNWSRRAGYLMAGATRCLPRFRRTRT